MSAATRSYNKVARARSEERTRSDLLDAAERAFFSGSWDKTTLEDVAADAGTTKQTLLRHFGSRDGLIKAGSERAFARISEQRMTAPADDIAGAIDNLLNHYYEVGERALLLSAATGDDTMGELAQAGRKFHHEWVDHAFGAWLAKRKPAERKRVRGAIIALCDVQSWAILSRDLGYPRTQVRQTLITAIESLLGEETP